MITIRSTGFILFWTVAFDLLRGQASVDGVICTSYVCTYDLNITMHRTMTYRDQYLNTWPVTLNGNQLQVNMDSNVKTLSPNDFIMADGFRRQIIAINGQFPGPTIEVMFGATVVVRVFNFLRYEPVTIHFHGISQVNTNYMDGTDNVIQCSIPWDQSFTHRFIANPVGTHWYHSHIGAQRLKGLFGMFIVHDVKPTLTYFPVFVNEWRHDTPEDLEFDEPLLCENRNRGVAPPPRPPSSTPAPDCSFDGAELNPEEFRSALFGGRGRWQDQPFPLMQYNVTSGQRYRFRMVNAGHLFPLIISVDAHQLTLYATDGSPIKPLKVDSVFLHVAETIEFEITANRVPGRYWIRADTQCPGLGAKGILAYQGYQTRTDDPVTDPKVCTSYSQCTVFNCPFAQYPKGSNKLCVSLYDADSSLSNSELNSKFGLDDPNPTVYFINVGMNAGPSINGRRFLLPNVPLFQNPSAAKPCVGPPCADGCSCRCANSLTIPYGQTVQFIVSNLQPDPNTPQDGYHVMHLHGFNFAVLEVRFPDYNNDTGEIIRPNGDITCDSDVLCANPHWSISSQKRRKKPIPVIKDTIAVPIRGYVVLRFRATNPGYWLFHCHVDAHVLGGMVLLIQVAPDRIQPPPPGFPRCYDPSDNANNDYYYPTTTVRHYRDSGEHD